MPNDPKQTQKPPPRAEPPPAGDRSSPPRSSQEWPDEESSTRTTEATITMAAPLGPRASTRAVLTVVAGPNVGRVYSLPDGEASIGRGRETTIRIDDGGASRRHARVVSGEAGRYWLEDLQSTNGTFVAGHRVERVELSSGDRIHVGPNVVLSFAIVDAQAERLAHQLYESSVRDPLTRAHNRRYLVDRLTAEIAYARRHTTDLSLILFDLDHFKQINDAHGHLAGDDVLRDTAALVTRLIRTEDVFARYGGEEFIVLVRGISHANVGRFAERLRSAVERLDVVGDGKPLRVTISVGYASLHELAEPQRKPEALLRLADERLYRAKSGGRNRVCGD